MSRIFFGRSKITVAFFFLLLSACSFEKEQPEAESALPMFRKVSDLESQVHFINKIEEDSKRNIIRYQGYYDGGGVAVADFNNDDLIDLFFTGNMVQNRLYLNEGNLRFKDVTASAGLKEGGFGWYTGATVVDINNDGWMDLYVCKSGLFQPENRRNQLFINNRDLTFTESAREYGLDHSGYSTQGNFFDFDRDGDLDMYLANYGPADITLSRDQEHKRRYLSDSQSGDRLFENQEGKFIDITSKAGIRDTPQGFTHSVGIGDFNRDGWPDLFVCNDFTEHDFYYVNNGDGTFSESVKESFKHLSNFSMGNDVADFNNDGLPDILVLDMVAEDNKRLKENMGGMQLEDFNYFLKKGYYFQYMFNMLHMNTGNDSFSEIAHLAGVSNTDWSWAPLFVDFDNDGWKDLYVTNGLKRDARNQDARYVFVDLLKQAQLAGRKGLTENEWEQALDAMPSQKLKNYMFRNRDGLTFEKVTDSWGLQELTFSNGAAYCDLDNDGDLDLVVNNINQKASIYENLVEDKEWIAFDIEGPLSNNDGIGAEISLWQNGRQQFQQVYFNHGFRSAMAGAVHFGLGSNDKVDSVSVRWPGGEVQKIKELITGQVIDVKYRTESKIATSIADDEKLFTESTLDVKPDYQHKENTFDDYKREILLPHTMSALGPFISVGDVNGDNLDDFFIGGSIGNPGRVYIQQASGGFEATNQNTFRMDKDFEDAGSLFFDGDGDNDLDLYVVSGGNEYPNGDNRYQDRLYLNDGKGSYARALEKLPAIRISGSIAVPTDFDGDGDTDLFIGGRQTPGKYPYPTSSLLLENDKGTFNDVSEQWAKGLGNLGMVTSASWIDYDLDSDADLIVAGEWMQVTVMQNVDGLLQKAEVGLDNTTGWWFSLIAEDIDNDGDEDLIAGNVGLNYKYKASVEDPFEIFSTDFDGNGTNDIVLAYHQDSLLFPLRGKSCSAQQMPSLTEKFPTYSSFAVAELNDVYGQSNLESALHYQAKQFASVFIENLGGGTFEFHPLPNYAQISAVQGIVAKDFDGDGLKDLVVAGNMYGSEVETVRNDAGFGMYLKNSGKGSFDAVPFHQSGLFLDGDIKSLSLIRSNDAEYIIAGTNRDIVKAVKITQ